MVLNCVSSSVALQTSPIACCQCCSPCRSVEPAFSKDSEQRGGFFDLKSLLWFSSSRVPLHRAGGEQSTLRCNANRENWSFSDA